VRRIAVAVVAAAAVRPVRRAREKLQLPLPAVVIGGGRRLRRKQLTGIERGNEKKRDSANAR